jgi:metal transporter CNNM
MEYLISIVLVVLSGLFSGLTLGLLSLDAQSLARRAKHGDENAATIYPVRENGNLLLTTLLLGNVAVNTTLSIFLSGLASGLVAGITATALIVVMGEIIPQAVITRHALVFGARTIWFTKLAIIIAYPIAYPISVLLNKVLGSELPTTYSHHELMDIISEHEDSEHSAIDADEERILHGALQFSRMEAREVMTPAEKVVSCDENQRLTPEFLTYINEAGFSRLPVYSGDPSNIVGMLFVKDLIVEDDNISIKATDEAFDKKFLSIKSNEKLDIVLTKMLKSRMHQAMVYNKNKRFQGVITLEDIIEEIIQQEIEDEDDEIEEVVNK